MSGRSGRALAAFSGETRFPGSARRELTRRAGRVRSRTDASRRETLTETEADMPVWLKRICPAVSAGEHLYRLEYYADCTYQSFTEAVGKNPALRDTTEVFMTPWSIERMKPVIGTRPDAISVSVIVGLVTPRGMRRPLRIAQAVCGEKRFWLTNAYGWESEFDDAHFHGRIARMAKRIAGMQLGLIALYAAHLS
ncbi:hypothetical protein KGQ55_01295 [Patescibacteria group bacterium]|nr:hypothetical protein [Patescibacteria group bacterium]